MKYSNIIQKTSYSSQKYIANLLNIKIIKNYNQIY